MIKKMISTLCAMFFCLGLLPIAAYAVEGGGHTEDTVMSEPAQLAVDGTGAEPASGCICTELCSEGDTNADCPVCSAESAELDKVCVGVAPMLSVTALAAGEHDSHSDGWTELTADTTTLSGGSYYLSDDVVYTGAESITVSGEVILCLNGQELNLNGRTSL